MRKVRLLRGYLVVFGILNIAFVSFTAPLLLGDLLLWEPRSRAVELMLGSLYFAMGVQMLVAARNPLPHKVFIDFVILANVLHAAIMMMAANSFWHYLDAALIGLMGMLPLVLYPWNLKFLFRP